MIVYPYRTPEGGRNILEAYGLDDALSYLRDSGYPGSVLCEYETTVEALRAIPSCDVADLVDRLLANGPSYVA